jgi:hypothetical protein
MRQELPYKIAIQPKIENPQADILPAGMWQVHQQ